MTETALVNTDRGNKSAVLIVDDYVDNLSILHNLLAPLYVVKAAGNGKAALRIAQSDSPPDLILLDVEMPEMDGYEVCRQLKASAQTESIPVIFLTARSHAEDEEKGLAIGAVDYITKPITPGIVLARVRTQLMLKASADFLRNKADYLQAEVAARTKEVTEVQDVTTLTLASLAETRDTDTGNHLRRTQGYILALALKLRNHPRFAEELTDSFIDMLFKSSPLHDIGKVGIPDHILLKPGKLTAEEFEVMKTHTTLGYEAIDHAEKILGRKIPFLQIAKDIALYHQEKWDGSGYPKGLIGDAIPVAARLMAVADVYDALICRRVYKAAMPHTVAVEIILEGHGRHFDPDMVDAFVELQDRFQAIAAEFDDSDEDLQSMAMRQNPLAAPQISGSAP